MSKRLKMGGIFLAALTSIGLAVFMLLAAKNSYQRDMVTGSGILSLVFSPALAFYVDNQAPADLYALQFASAILALAGSVSALSRKYWILAWIGSIAALTFGFLALISMYLIGVSHLDFRTRSGGDSLREHLGMRNASSTHFGVVLTIVVLVLGSIYAWTSLFEALLGSVSMAFLVTDVFLLSVFFSSSSVHSRWKELKRRKGT